MSMVCPRECTTMFYSDSMHTILLLQIVRSVSYRALFLAGA